MISQLDANLYERVRPLLKNVEHNLTMAAVVDGTCPGTIWVDDAAAPRTALMSTPEGHFLAGRKPAAELARSLRQLLTERIFPAGREAGWLYFTLHYPDRRWEKTVAGLLEAKHPVWDYQQYLVLQDLKTDWRAGLPAEFEMRRVDEDLLARTDLRNVNWLKGWATGNFGSVPQFVARGFGFCLVHGDEIVSWCMSDCVSGPRGEVGIHTDEKHRRRGFATRTLAATVEHCLSHGLTHIGWHCWSGNLASAATARAVGFEKVLDHHGVHMWFNEFDSLLVNGNLCLLREHYADAAEWYDRAFAHADAGAPDARTSAVITDRAAWGRYRCKAACAHALAGNQAAAAASLDRAFDTGTDRWLLF